MECKKLKLAIEIVVNSLVLNIFEDMVVSKKQHGWFTLFMRVATYL